MKNIPCPHCAVALPALPDRFCASCGTPLSNGFYNAVRKEKIGDYRILSYLGSGGTGEVFAAEQMSLGRKVALKILHPELSRNTEYVKRFFHEVRMLAKVTHQNVIAAIEAGIDGEFVYFSMPLQEGRDLKWHLEHSRAFTRREVLNILRQTACALSYCWREHQLIHRDIKPANLLLTREGVIKIMDMGISKEFGSHDTLSGAMLGTPYYVSPEQARATSSLSWQTDMYSLGVTAYELLTGTVPYHHTSISEVLRMQVEFPVRNPRKINPRIRPPIAQMVMRMMQKKPSDRYRSWEDFVRAVDMIAANRAIQTSGLRLWVQDMVLENPKRIRYIIVAGVMIAVCLGCAAAIVVLALHETEPLTVFADEEEILEVLNYDGL